jgi:hypothetical protein
MWKSSLHFATFASFAPLRETGLFVHELIHRFGAFPQRRRGSRSWSETNTMYEEFRHQCRNSGPQSFAPRPPRSNASRAGLGV